MTHFSDNLLYALEAYARYPSSQHIEINRDRVEVKWGAKGPPVDQTISALSEAIGQAEFSPRYKFDRVLQDVKILRSQNKSWLTGESKKNKEAFDKLEAAILNKKKEWTFLSDNELEEILNLPEPERTNKLMLLAAKFPPQMFQNLDKLKLTDPKEREAILYLCLSHEKDYIDLAQSIDPSRQKDLVALAKICAEKDPRTLLENFEKFQIDHEREDDLVALAKICAEKDPRGLLDNFEKFRIDPSRHDDLVALAKIMAEKQPEALTLDIDKFKIHPSRQDDLVALAKIVAEKAPWLFTNQFIKFQIDPSRQDDLVALAKICAEKNSWALANSFEKFQIEPSRQEGLVAIAMIMAEKEPWLFTDQFIKFQIDPSRQDDLVALAMIYAKKEPELLAATFKKFQIEASRRKEVIRQIDPNRIDINNLPQVRGLARNHEFFSRIRERDPALFIDLFMGSDMPEELKEFKAFLETHEVDLISLLSFEYRMNPSLPMRKEVVQLFLYFKSSPDLVKLRLAMQTHPDFEEIARMAKGGIPEAKLTPKEAFFELEIEEQRSQMLRAQILRERDALPIANRILKDVSEGKPVDKELLEQALKHYKKVGAEASGKVHERLTTLIKDPQQKTHIKAHAIQALAEIENDPQNANRKAFLLNELQNTNNPVLQVVLLDALARYTFTAGEDLAQIKSMIRTLSSKDPLDTNLKKSLVYLATTIPDEETLKIAYQLVNKEPWDTTASKQNLAIKGDFNLFPYRPAAHDSQKQLNFVIGQRLVELKRSEMEKRAQAILGEYKANPDSHASLAQLERNIKGFQSGIRYYPTPLFMPAGTVCFRGINAKKGEKLAEAAFLDFWVKGSGSSDLSLFDRSDLGTWSKVGQMFASTTLDYVMRGYFDENGMLMTIPGEALNEQILRRNIRLQREDSIHFVSYTRLAHHQISQLFISNVSQPRIEALAKVPLKVTDKAQKTPTMEKMARRNLEKTPSELLSLKAPSELLSLKDLVSYFDPKNNLATEIREKMTPLGLREATTQEIIDENLTRHIMLGLLKDHLTDPDLIATFAEPPTIEPLEVINR